MSTNTTSASLWFPRPRPSPGACLRLFCFPYAGGGAAVFGNWPRYLPASVEVCPAQLPGRGSRTMEPARTRLAPVVEELAIAIRPLLDMPSVFFGHSMGALICFELARRLRRDAGLQPSHLYVSGCRAPQSLGLLRRTYQLPDPALVERLRSMGGTPAELFEHKELMQLMLPLIRADIELTETYAYHPEPPLALPVTAFGGSRDPHVRRSHLVEWKGQTSSDFALRVFDGDHLFIHQSEAQLLESLARDLRGLARGF